MDVIRSLDKTVDKDSFWLGVSASIAGYALWRIVRSLMRKPVYERNLSHLHHLDLSRILANGRADKDSTRAHGNSGDSQVYQVVLTGGPCAGKSSAIEYFAAKIREHGFDVYQVPEVPTLLLNGGCVYPGLDGGERLVAFETSLIELQLQMEQTFYNVAKSSGRPGVIFYDRGLLDVAAYLPRDLWHSVVNHNQWLRDGLLSVLERYDLILHMVSAANGAEKHYQVRKETLEEARDLDEKIQACWRGHPQHRIVDNSSDFEDKLERALDYVLELILE